ncbi:MAG: nuclear transport factor 2 family protein [Eggerthellaceae bacterium]|nr:nuclear transport factor 2 family protein [Eggerthellaceae bacterium]
MATTDEEICAQLYRDLCDASSAKDADGMAKVLADDYALVHMTGMRQPKRAYIAAVLDGTLNYYSAEHDSIEVTVTPDGEHAAIRGRSRVSAAVFGGGRHTWRLQQDLKAEKRDGEWLLVESLASTY